MLLLWIRTGQSQTVLLDRRLRRFFDRLGGLVPYVPRVVEDSTLFADALHEVKFRLAGRDGLVAADDARSSGRTMLLGCDDCQVLLGLSDLSLDTRRIRLIVSANRLQIDLDALPCYVLHRPSEVTTALLALFCVRIRRLLSTTGANYDS